MRFQTMYVDLRPVILKWLGILIVMLVLVLFVASVRPDLMRATAKAQLAYQQSSNNGQINFGYWDHCLRSGACVRSYLVTWSAPLIVRASITGSLLFGAVTATFGMVWRPEVIAMRDTRVNALKVEESRLNSPTAPRGLL